MAAKSGSSLRVLLLTPERVPDFLIPSRSPLRVLSPDRVRLLSDHDDSPGPAQVPPGPAASSRLLLRPPPRLRTERRDSADTDVSTQAAMSLPHVEKVTTPYGFRAVLAASPCTRRRESLFHRNKPVTVTVTQTPQGPPLPGSGPGPGPAEGRSRAGARHVKVLGVHVMRELRRPAAALKALSPAVRRREPR